MKEPKVAVVILNWNGKSFLESFLPSVLKYNPSFAEVFVADNGSTDGSLAFLKTRFPEVATLDLKENHGYTGGYNLALEQIKATYYVLLNSDIEVEEGWIDRIVSVMDQDPEIAACQPKILAYSDRERFEYAGAAGGFIDYLGYPFCRGRVFDHTEEDKGQYNSTAQVFWATGACLFVRASDFHRAGALDPVFFAHMEEIDLCWRLGRMGKKIICEPSSVVYHVGGGTLPRNNPRKTFLNFRNNLLLLAKNLPTRRFYPVLLQRLVLDQVAAVVFLLKGQNQDFLAVYKALFAFFLLMPGKRKQSRQLTRSNGSPVYHRSIVFSYFLKRIKRFDQLKPKAFRGI